MKVAAIYGSPRKNGNSAQMMDALLSEFPQSADIHKIYLTDFLHFNRLLMLDRGYAVLLQS